VGYQAIVLQCCIPSDRLGETKYWRHEAILKHRPHSLHPVDKGIRVMWRIINAIYEDYCQARLDEMLKLDAVK
jgi:hypothetical protein